MIQSTQSTQSTPSTFPTLGVSEPILRALAAAEYIEPTPIQTQAIPPILGGRDLLGVAQTGTGKTAAFAVPVLQRLAAERSDPGPKGVRALVLAPTRELALQIDDGFATYGRHLGMRRAVVLGGVGQVPQVRALARGVDVLVATPGRLLDLLDQGHVRLDRVQVLVLDEADRMLDMGFVRDVRKIVSRVPAKRQSLLFSATMPSDVATLAQDLLRDPVRVDVSPKTVTVDLVEQHVWFIEAPEKRRLLGELLTDPAYARVIVFTRTKHGANRVAKQLVQGGVDAEAIHGNKSQGARQRALDRFKRGEARVLVATDIAARGIDVDGVSHVINFELPNVPESYVHRIGRTARAGASGVALSFCDTSERAYLRDIERLTRRPLTVVGGSRPAEPPVAPSHAHREPRGHAAPRLAAGGPPRRSGGGGARSGGGGSRSFRPRRRSG